MLSHNDLIVAINNNLTVIAVVVNAFFAHDPGIVVGKTDLLFVFDRLVRIQCGLAFFKGFLADWIFSIRFFLNTRSSGMLYPLLSL